MEREFWDEQLNDKFQEQLLHPSPGAQRFSTIMTTLLATICVIAALGVLFRVAVWAVGLSG